MDGPGALVWPNFARNPYIAGDGRPGFTRIFGVQWRSAQRRSASRPVPQLRAHLVERDGSDESRGPTMTPGDVAQSVLPLSSGDLSIFGLFWSAHVVVKAVMIGLLVASLWVWAIAVEKTLLYMRTRRS